MAIEIRPLRATDDRGLFHSGDLLLDRFLTQYAGQNQFRHHIGTTYVAAEGDIILGFATVAAGNIEGDALPSSVRVGLPHYPLPILRLARLAVDTMAQHRGVGSALLRHVFLLALRMSEELDCLGIQVDAKSDAVDFYTRVGFSALDVSEGAIDSRPTPTPMFLPLAPIQAAVDTEARKKP